MCAWIEVHQSLPTHPKTMEAAMLLDVSEPVIVGHLVCLWTWAVDARPDGVLDLSKPRVIARAARWEGEPGRFVDALVGVRFLDEDGAIHDWDDYTGRLMERRERINVQTRARMQAYRERLAQQKRLSSIEAPVTHSVTRNERNESVTVTPGYAPTQPNPTVPNRTQPPPTTPRSVAPAPAERSAPLAVATGQRRPDPLWDAFKLVWPQGPRTDTERGKWNKAAQDLRKGGVTPEEILAAAQHWPNVMGPATMTPMGIASNLGLLLEGPQVNGRSAGTVVAHTQKVTEGAYVRRERSLTALVDEHQRRNRRDDE